MLFPPPRTHTRTLEKMPPTTCLHLYTYQPFFASCSLLALLYLQKLVVGGSSGCNVHLLTAGVCVYEAFSAFSHTSEKKLIRRRREGGWERERGLADTDYTHSPSLTPSLSFLDSLSLSNNLLTFTFNLSSRWSRKLVRSLQFVMRCVGCCRRCEKVPFLRVHDAEREEKSTTESTKRNEMKRPEGEQGVNDAHRLTWALTCPLSERANGRTKEAARCRACEHSVGRGRPSALIFFLIV